MAHFAARYATEAEVADWDAHVVANPNGGNMLQSAPFLEVKERQGWKPVYLVFEGAGYRSYNPVLEKRVPFFGRLWYLIKGPDVAEAEHVPEVLAAAAELARKRSVFALKIEPDVIHSERVRAMFTRSGLQKSFNIQVNDTTALLDLTPEPEELLKSLHSRGRNAVRRAQREGVQVHTVESSEDNFKAMYAMVGSARQGKLTVTPRPYEYYRHFWRTFVDAGLGRLFFVYENGKPSVGAFVIKYGRKGTYKDGGSTPRRSQYGDSHLMQWTALNELRAEGVTEYDLCGTPPADQLKNKDHPQYGMGLFKTSFTKTVTEFVGCYDWVLRPLRYRLWTAFGERAARQLYWRKHQQPFY